MGITSSKIERKEKTERDLLLISDEEKLYNVFNVTNGYRRREVVDRDTTTSALSPATILVLVKRAEVMSRALLSNTTRIHQHIY